MIELTSNDLTTLHLLALHGKQHLNSTPYMVIERLKKAQLITEIWSPYATTRASGGEGFCLTEQGAVVCRERFNDIPEEIEIASAIKESSNRI